MTMTPLIICFFSINEVIYFYVMAFIFSLYLVYIVLPIFYCTAWWPSYTYMYRFFFLTLSCSIISDEIQLPGLHSRTSLLIHSKSNSLYLLTPSSQSIPVPPPPPRQWQLYSPSQRFSFLCKGSFLPYTRFQRYVVSDGISCSLSD